MQRRKAVQYFLAVILLATTARFGPAQSWQPLQNQPEFGASTALLLTDGRVLVQENGGSTFHILSPDAAGSYLNGTWSSQSSLPPGYSPLYYASAVLADGRVVMIGGEYNFQIPADTNLGAIYDPQTNTWASLAPPSNGSGAGDASGVVLADGRWMVANIFNGQSALLNPATLAWTNVSGASKSDRNDEEGWNLLPDGSILTVDAINAPQAERFIPGMNKWIKAGETPASLEDPASQEIGPAVLRPDGTVFATGGTRHTAIYTPPANPSDPGNWAAGPDFPVTPEGPLDIADGPACLLPNGHVLMAASPGVFHVPTHFFEFDGAHLNELAGIPNGPFEPSFVGRMLLLPTGQVLFTDGSPDVEIYTPDGSPNPAWAPVVTSWPTSIKPGTTYTLSGTQFNGLSQAVAYGDDAQAATNYPLVRITNRASGHVRYARTHDHSTMGVATGSTVVSTQLDAPTDLELGINDLVVVANGIPSSSHRVDYPQTVAIDVKPGDNPSSINPNSNGKTPVAILSSTTFSAPAQTDPATLTFGRTGDESSLSFCSGAEDVNSDGLRDLVCHFTTNLTGFQASGNTIATLKGMTVAGMPIQGTDAVVIIGH